MNLIKRNKVYAQIIPKKWKAAKLLSPISAAAYWGMFVSITKIASMQNLLKYTFLYTIYSSVDFCRLFSLLTAKSDFFVYVPPLWMYREMFGLARKQRRLYNSDIYFI